MHSIKDCVKKSIIRIANNMTGSLTRDCQMHLNYCLTAESHRSAMARYSAVKSGIKFLDGKMDACSRAANGSVEFQNVMRQMGLSIGCPVEKYKTCNGTRLINVRPWKRFLPLFSGAPVTYHISFDHDSVRMSHQ